MPQAAKKTSAAKTSNANVSIPAASSPAPESSDKKQTVGLSAAQFKMIADQIDTAINRAFADMDARLALALQSPGIQPAIAKAVRTAVVDVVKKQMEPLDEKISTLQANVAKLQQQQDDLEQYGRRWNLLFHGIHENDNENCEQKVRLLCEEKLKLKLPPGAVQRAHRIGSKKAERSRPIIVRFTDYNVKRSVYKNKRQLKGTRLLITENLTPPRQALYKQVRDCKSVSASWTNDGNIFVLFKDKIHQIFNVTDLMKLTESVQ